MVGCIVCAGFTMRLQISLTTCPPSQRKRAWEKKWSAASKGSFKNSGLRHRSVCPPDSHHPCLLQSVHLFVDMSRFPSSMLTTVCLPALTGPDSLHARNSLLIFSDSHHPCSLQSVLLFWQVQIPIIHAHYSLSSYFDRSRFPSSMLTTVCWYFQIPFIHACYSLSTCLSIWVFDCVFSLHACTSCGLSTSFNLLINMSGSLHACYACSDVHSIVRPHLPVHISLWLCVPSSCLH